MPAEEAGKVGWAPSHAGDDAAASARLSHPQQRRLTGPCAALALMLGRASERAEALSTHAVRIVVGAKPQVLNARRYTCSRS